MRPIFSARERNPRGANQRQLPTRITILPTTPGSMKRTLAGKVHPHRLRVAQCHRTIDLLMRCSCASCWHVALPAHRRRRKAAAGAPHRADPGGPALPPHRRAVPHLHFPVPVNPSVGVFPHDVDAEKNCRAGTLRARQPLAPYRAQLPVKHAAQRGYIVVTPWGTRD